MVALVLFFCEINSCVKWVLVRYLLGRVLFRGVAEEWFWDGDVSFAFSPKNIKIEI